MILHTLSGPVAARNPDNAHLAQINSLPSPPLAELRDDDVHVRRCRLAGDAVDSHFGCFRTHDLERLLALTHGAPALVGHNRAGIPVARFFGGAIEEHAGHRYIVPCFFWPKAHSQAEDFRVLLDTAIISEASIAFTFEKPSCSICARDIRECEHEPGGFYGLKQCHYFYDGIDRVLEGSFVYRGAQPGTGILAEISQPLALIKSRKTIKLRYNGQLYEAIAPNAGTMNEER